MANKPGYFDDYYKDNREKILSARKKRYDEDPEYREKVLKSSRDYRKSQRQQSRVKVPRYQKPLVGRTADGVELKLFSVGAMAVFLQRSVQALNHWEKNGLLPRTPYRDSRGFRFYTTDMMAAVREEVGTKRRLFPVDTQMRSKIRAKWEALGVPFDYAGQDPHEAIRLTRRAK